MVTRSGNFLLKLRNLENIKRYQTRSMLFKRSVAEHTTGVFYCGYVLGEWEERKFGNKVNWEILSKKLMFHDAPEAITGDILSPTKNYTPKMKEAIHETERLIFEEQFIPLIPESWRAELKGYMLDGKDNTIEGLILKAADLMDGIFEIRVELQYSNNIELIEILQDYILKLTTIELQSVKYFLKYSLADLDLQSFYTREIKDIIDGYQFSTKHFDNILSVKGE